jgi:predicted RNase H-like HicB family nuclease
MIYERTAFTLWILGQLQGVWATGKTLEDCRQRLAEVIDGWVLVRLSRGLSIPPLGDVSLTIPKEMRIA